MKRTGLFTLILLVVLAIFAFPASAESPDLSLYSAGDIECVNALIASNNLAETQNAPDEWQHFIMWDMSGEPYRIAEMHIGERGVTGDIDLRALDALTVLNADNNQIASLNVSGMPALRSLNVSSNPGIALDVRNCAALERLDITNSGESMPDLTGLDALRAIEMYDWYTITEISLGGRTFTVSSTEGGGAYINSVNLDANTIDIDTWTNEGYTFVGWTGVGEDDRLRQWLLAHLPESGDYHAEAVYRKNDDVPYDPSQVSAVLDLPAHVKSALGEIDENAPASWGFAGWSVDPDAKQQVITYLSCNDLGIAGDVDMTAFAHLRSLNLSGNAVESLDLSGLAHLAYLEVNNNPSLTSLTITGCAALEDLQLNATAVEALDLAGIDRIRSIGSDGSTLKTLALADGTTFSLDCGANGAANIQYVDAINAYVGLHAEGNDGYAFSEWQDIPDEDCFTDPNYGFSYESGSQYAIRASFDVIGAYYAPDVALVNALIANNGLGADADTPQNWGFAEWEDRNGIQYLIALHLEGWGLQGDVSLTDCKTLGYVNFNANQITSLALNGCNNLNGLEAHGNPLATFTVSRCDMLESLEVSDTQLDALPLDALPNLRVLSCARSLVASIDLGNNPELRELYCENTPVARLDASAAYALEALNIHGCTALRELLLPGRSLALPESENGTVRLANYEVPGSRFQVIATANAGWHFDHWEGAAFDNGSHAETWGDLAEGVQEITAVFTEGAPDIGNYNPADVAVIDGMIARNVLDNAPSSPSSWDGFIDWRWENDIGYVEGIRLNGCGLSGDVDLQGLEYLRWLEIGNNLITGLNVGGLTLLENLQAHNNRLTALDLTDCALLTSLNLNDNPLVGLDVSNQDNLMDLSVSGCGIDSVTFAGRAFTAQSGEGGEADIRYINLYDNTIELSAFAYYGYAFSGWTGLADGADVYYTNIIATLPESGDFTATAAFVPTSDRTYSEGDIAAMATFAASIGWTDEQIDLTNPDSWVSFVDWTYDEGEDALVVTGLHLYFRSDVRGGANVSGFKHLREMNIVGCKLTSVDAVSLDKLTTVRLHETPSLTYVHFTGSDAFEALNINDSAIADLDLSGFSRFRYLDAYNSALTSFQWPTGSVAVTAGENGKVNIQHVNGNGYVMVHAEPYENYALSAWEHLPDVNRAFDRDVDFQAENGASYNFNAEFTARDSYYAPDVAYINGMIARNGLGAEANAPQDWGFAEWEERDSVQHLIALRLEGWGLQGNIDLYGCVMLRELDLDANQISFLIVADCVSLGVLEINDNPISTLMLSNNESLSRLEIRNTGITALSLDAAPHLEYLYCERSSLMTLDLSGNPDLRDLCCDNTSISRLDVSNATALEALNMHGCIMLRELRLPGRSLTLEASENGSIRLAEFNLWDYRYRVIATPSWGYRFDLWDGTAFDDANRADTWCTLEDGQDITVRATFTAGEADIGDYNRNDVEAINWLIAHNGLNKEPNKPDDWGDIVGWVWDGDTMYVERLSIGGQGLTGYADMSAFSHLRWLEIGNNWIQGLEISGLTLLESISAENNALTAVNLSDCALLETLNLGDNPLSELDLSNLNALKELYISGCGFSEATFAGRTFAARFGEGGEARINWINLRQNRIEMSAYAYGDYAFSGWDGLPDGADAYYSNVVSTLPESGDFIATANFTAKNELTYFAEDIAAMETFANSVGWTSDHIDLGDPASWGCEWTYDQSVGALVVTGLSQYYREDMGGEADVTGFKHLRELNLVHCNLTSVVASGLDKLVTVRLFETPTLEFVNFTGCAALEALSVNDSAIQEIDLSDFPRFRYLDAYNSALTSFRWPTGYVALTASENGAVNIQYVNAEGYVVIRAVPNENYTLSAWNGLPDASRAFERELDFNAEPNAEYALRADFVACGSYYAPDVALVNALIANNGLGAGADDPDNWGWFSQWGNYDDVWHLQALHLDGSGLTGAVDVSGCATLNELYVSTNQITSLDVGGCTNLAIIRINENPITAFAFTQNDQLWELSVRDTPLLTDLTLHSLPNLKILSCERSGLTALDLTGNPALREVRCDTTPITLLDASSAESLETLSMGGCFMLRELRLHDRSLTLVDPPDGSGSVRLSKYEQASRSFNAIASASDGYHFERWEGETISDTSNVWCWGELTEGDHVITAVFAEGAPEISNFNAADVAVVDRLIARHGLNLQPSNPYTWYERVDWRSEENVWYIETLRLGNQELMGDIDLQGLSYLRSLEIGDNPITGLNIRGLTRLERLQAWGTRLTEIDLQDNTALNALHLDGSPIRSLDLSAQNELKSLYISGCGFNSVSFAGRTFTALQGEGGDATIVNIDLNMNRIEMYAAPHGGYAFSGWTGLAEGADGQNGHLFATLPETGDFTATANFVPAEGLPRLADDVTAMATFASSIGWTSDNIDFSDPGSWEWFTDWTYDQGSDALVVTSINLDGQGSVQGDADVSGFKHLRALTMPNCQLTSVNANGLDKLANVWLQGMPTLRSVDITGCTALETMTISDSGITALDLSGCANFLYIDAYNSALTRFTWRSGNIALTASENGAANIEHVNRDGHVDLRAQANENYVLSAWEGLPPDNDLVFEPNAGFDAEQGVAYNIRANFDAFNAYYAPDVALVNALIESNGLRAVKDAPESWDFAGWDPVNNIQHLRELWLEDRGLTGDISFNGHRTINYLSLNNNQITSLDVRGCVKLDYLSTGMSTISTLALGGNNALRTLYISDTALLTEVDFSALPNLNLVNCEQSGLTALDLRDNPYIKTIFGGKTQITLLDASTAEALELVSVSNCPALRELRFPDRSLKLMPAQNGAVRLTNYTYDTHEFNVIASADDGWHFDHWEGAAFDNPAEAYGSGSIGEGEHAEITAVFAEGALELGDYDASDVAVIDRLIARNTLNAQPSIPGYWGGFVDWTRDENGIRRIERLRFNNQNMTGDVDLQGLTCLRSLEIANNRITGLNINGLTLLDDLQANDNKLTTVDLSSCELLLSINISNNPLDSFDLSHQNALKTLHVGGCGLNVVSFAGRTYTVQSGEGGSVDIGWIDLNEGVIEIEAFPDGDYIFTGWSDLPEGTDGLNYFPVVTLPETGDFTATANFEPSEGLTYCEEDVAAMATFASQRGWTSNRIDLNDPASWAWFVDWIYDQDIDMRVINNLYLNYQYDVSGVVDVSGFKHLRELNITGCGVTSVNANGLSKLVRVDLHSNLELISADFGGCTALESLNINDSAITAIDMAHSARFRNIDAYNSKLTRFVSPTSDIALTADENGSVNIQHVNKDGYVELRAFASQSYGLCEWNGLPDGSLVFQPDTSFQAAPGGTYAIHADFAAHGTYYAPDVALVNAIIDGNGLVADKDDPGNWDFANWNEYYGIRHLYNLNLEDRGLHGELNLNGFKTLSGLYVSRNPITLLDASEVKTLSWIDLNGCSALRELRLPDRSFKLMPAQNGAVRLTNYNYETHVFNVIASADEGWHFDHWEGATFQSAYQAYIGGTIAEGEHAEIYAVFAEGAPEIGNYDASDVAVINRLIARNNLNAQPSMPNTWGNFVNWKWEDGGKGRIEGLQMNGRNLTGDIDLQGLPCLRSLEIYDNPITGLNVRGLTLLDNLQAWNTQLTALDLIDCAQLVSLNLNGSPLNGTGLDLSNQNALRALYVSDCGFDSVTFAGRTFTVMSGEGGNAKINWLNLDEGAIEIEAYPDDGYAFSGWSDLSEGADGYNRNLITALPETGDFTATASFTRSEGLTYCEEDVAVMATFATQLGWTSDRIDLNDPATWGWFVDWTYDQSIDRLIITNLYLYYQTDVSGDVDLSAFKHLRALSITGYGVTSVNASGLDKLVNVWLENNQALRSANFTGCAALESLSVNNSAITALELPAAQRFRYIDAYDAKLTRFSTPSGGITLTAGGNGAAYLRHMAAGGTIEIDARANEGYALSAWTGFPDAQLSFYSYVTFAAEPGVTYDIRADFARSGSYYAPDVARITALIENNGLVADKDDPGSWSFVNWSWHEVQHVTSINLEDSGLQGDVDLSGFVLVGQMNLSGNQITTLDVSGCFDLNILDVSDNPLTEIVFGNHDMRELNCRNTQLTALDARVLQTLEFLYCSGSPIASLDLSGNERIMVVQCANTPITLLDVSSATDLQNCDIDGCAQIKTLRLPDRSLEIADDIVNGTVRVSSYNGDSGRLVLLALPDEGYRFGSWSGLDGESSEALLELFLTSDMHLSLSATFEEGAPDLGDFSPEDVAVVNAAIYNNGLSLSPNAPETWHNMNWNWDTVPHRIIDIHWGWSNLKGVLDISALTELKYLELTGNQLTGITLGAQALETLEVQDNLLAELNVAGMRDLVTLNVSSNRLTALDLTGCTALKTVTLSDNPLQEMPDLSGAEQMESLYLYGCDFSNAAFGARRFSVNASGGGFARINYIDLTTNTMEVAAFPYDGNIFANWTGDVGEQDVKRTQLQIRIPEQGDVSLTADFASEEVAYDPADVEAFRAFMRAVGLQNNVDLDNPDTWDPFTIWVYDDARNVKVLTDVFVGGDRTTGSADLTAMKELRTFSAYNTKLTSINASQLDKLASLTLNYSNEGIESMALTLTGCAALETLELERAPLRVLDLSDSPRFQTLYANNSEIVSVLWQGGGATVDTVGDGLARIYSIDLPSAHAEIYAEPNAGAAFTGWDNAYIENTLDQYAGAYIQTDAENAYTAHFEAGGGYSAESVLAINNLIEHNGLDATKDDPESWSFVNWTTLGDPELKVIEFIELAGQNLHGAVEIANCRALSFISLESNQITSLNITGCPRLDSINISENPLTSINQSVLDRVQWLYCNDTQITALDMPGNKKVQEIYCVNTPITLIDVSSSQDLAALDVSACHSLKTLKLPGRSITIDGSTEHGAIRLSYYDNSTSDYGLVALPEDGYVMTEWTGIPDIDANSPMVDAHLADGMHLTVSAVFAAAQEGDIDLGDYSPEDVAAINAIITRNNLNAAVNLPETWDFASWNYDETPYRVTRFEQYAVGLTGVIDLSALERLEHVDISGNYLTGVIVRNLSLLEILDFQANRVTELDLTGLPRLRKLNVAYNDIGALDVSGCTALEHLAISSNPMAMPDISTLAALEELYLVHNEYTEVTMHGVAYSVAPEGAGTVEITSVNRRTGIVVFTAKPNEEAVFGGWVGAPEGADALCNVLNAPIPASGELSLTARFVETAAYDPDDLAACRAFIQASGIQYEFKLDDPSSWWFATWAVDPQTNLMRLVRIGLSGWLKGDVDLTAFTALRYLTLSFDDITSLDVSGLDLLCDVKLLNNGKLTSVIFDGCGGLMYVDIGMSGVTSLDLAGSAKLVSVQAEDSALESVTTPGFSIDVTTEKEAFAAIWDVQCATNEARIVTFADPSRAFECWTGLPDGSTTDQNDITITVPSGGAIHAEAFYARNIGLSATSVLARAGDVFRLACSVESQRLEWSSDDESVLTVDENGTVTTVANGTATIRARHVNNHEMTETCTVTVESHTTLTLPGALTRIEAETFMGNAAIVAVKLGASVQAIDALAFADCTSLRRVDLSDAPTACQIAENAFQNTPDAVLFVKEASEAHAYAAANGIMFVIAE